MLAFLFTKNMAEGKKSFVLYSDQRSIIELLSNEQAGILLKHIFAYVNDENPVDKEAIIMLAFEPIKLQMKRDLVKWESTKVGRSAGGKASAEARRLAKEIQQTLTNSTNVNSVEQTSTNPTVNDNVNVNVNDTVINIHTPTKVGDIDFSILLETINKIFERKFAVVSDAVKKKYKTLLKQGYTKTHIHTAMLNCKKDAFHRDNDYKHCTIEYFSRPKTIDLYGTELITEKKGIVGTYTIHDHL
jgi:hypothetical protein